MTARRAGARQPGRCLCPARGGIRVHHQNVLTRASALQRLPPGLVEQLLDLDLHPPQRAVDAAAGELPGARVTCRLEQVLDAGGELAGRGRGGMLRERIPPLPAGPAARPG